MPDLLNKYGNRPDGTIKGSGFFGELKRPDGEISTELSIGVNLDGKETDIPAIVPTLSKKEIDYLLSDGQMTDEIANKAIAHAKKRIGSGLSPFYQEGEQRAEMPKETSDRRIEIEPDHFKIDNYLNERLNLIPMNEQHEYSKSFAKSMLSISRHFLSQGYNAASALNRGVAAFSTHLGTISEFLEGLGVGESSNLFERAAEIYESNAVYWKQKATDSGSTFIDELIGEAIGGAFPGIGQFTLDVSSFLAFPFMSGYQTAEEKGKNPFVGALIEAGKTGTLAGLFKMIGPLKQYLKAPTMGTIFGFQEAENAPEGEKLMAFAKGAGTGVLYSLATPGGHLGLNEIRDNLKPTLETASKIIKNERGSIDIDIARKNHLKTITLAAERNGKGVFEYLTEDKGIAPEKAQKIIDFVNTDKMPQGIFETAKDLNDLMEVSGNKKPRKFIKTTEEALETAPELKEKIQDIDPQDYLIQPNKESLDIAQKRIEKGLNEAVDYALSETTVSAEKGATFIKLIEQFQKAGDFDKAAGMIEAYDLQLREAGRFVQAASLWSKGSPNTFIRWANKQLEGTKEKYGIADKILKRKPTDFKLTADEQKIILDTYKDFETLSGKDKADKTLELIDMVAKKVPPSFSELFDAYRYQNMLSSPKTHMRNLGENAFNTFVTAPADIATLGAIDYIKAGLFGKERKTYVSDTPVYLKAALNALPNAMKGFKETFKLGPQATLEKPDIGVMSKDSFQAARARQIPDSLTIISRFMEACDKFNMSLISAGEMARLKKNGLNDIEAYKIANESAEKYLYRGKLDPERNDISYPSKILSSMGVLMQESRRLPVLGTLSKWYVPFLKTPINKGIQMIERSPLGIIRGDINQEAAAKILLGSIVSGLGAVAAYEGETTWSVPSNEDEKKLFYESGRKPFSVKMGDTWIPIWYLGPFALPFAIPMAVKYYTEDSNTAMVDDGIDKVLAISEGMAQFIGSQTSTPAISAFFSAADGDIDYKLSSQTGFTVQQIIPAASLIRYVNTILDPVYRHPKGFIENIEANIPFLSQQLDARMTSMMEESTRNPINALLPYDIGVKDESAELMLPFKSSEARQKKIERKMDSITKDLKDGKITPEESMEKVFKLINANQQNIIKLGEDLEKQDIKQIE